MSTRKDKTAAPTPGSPDRRSLGLAAEDAVAEQLRREGFALLARNWRCREGEIDLVAREGDTLCFIEVRCKTDVAGGHPLETVTGPKQRQVLRVARAYLERLGSPDVPVRFDVAGVVPRDGRFRITYIRDAFEARSGD